ncbi:hypothetical protein [Weissella hellenica]|uniref:hypothetical protein n=1 Tax=Weissella hellenica TaxID=46256 RepID=UPI003886C79E
MKLSEAEQIVTLVNDYLPESELVYMINPYFKEDYKHANGFEIVVDRFNTIVSDFQLTQCYYAVLVDQTKKRLAMSSG